jgi:hypothetical protein
MPRELKHEYRPLHPIRLERLLACSVKLTRLKVGEVCGADLKILKPTQATVGYIQAYAQARKMSRMSREKLEATLIGKPIPVVIGPDRQAYVIDHHHHAVSLWIMGFKKAVVEIKEKCLTHTERAFWIKMRRSKWLHLYDEHGRELSDHRLLPGRVEDLRDNIYQSLAWAARREGAYARSAVAVSDFKWPDFFRRHLAPVDEKNFTRAIQKAVVLARTRAATGLPGHIRS